MRSIELISIVESSLSDVWTAWTTEDGLNGFFAEKNRVELAIGGAYELGVHSWSPELIRSRPTGVLAYVPERMLAFEWNQFPQGLSLDGGSTWVVVEFKEMDDELCEVSLTHLGWNEGADWETCYQYFLSFWPKVLQRFERYMCVGEIDWSTISRS